jgi:hypothetical protein
VIEIPRDRYDRPLILPPGGRGRPKPYTRTSKLAKATDDVGGLINWSAAQAVKGLIARPDLFEVARMHRDDEDQVKDIARRAKDAAASDQASNLGTVLHHWTEQLDLGLAVIGEEMPADYEALLEQYVEKTRGLEMIETELFVVCDELGAAGTLDRLIRLPDGAVVVGDLKTGRHAATFGALSCAIQTAVYAHGERYDPETGERTPLHPDLDVSRTLLLHMPLPKAEELPTVSLHMLDGAWGWYGAQLSRSVLELRKTKVASPYVLDAPALAL